MQIGIPVKFPIIGSSAKDIAEEIWRQSKGEIQVDIDELDRAWDYADILTAVQKGKVESGWIYSGYLSDMNPLFLIFSGPPFGLEPELHYKWLREGGGLQNYQKLYARFNIKAFPGALAGPEGAGWFKRPVFDPEDIKFLKIRTLGESGYVLTKPGAAIYTIPGPEIYHALKSGAVDAAEFSVPYIDELRGYYQVADFFYYRQFSS